MIYLIFILSLLGHLGEISRIEHNSKNSTIVPTGSIIEKRADNSGNITESMNTYKHIIVPYIKTDTEVVSNAGKGIMGYFKNKISTLMGRKSRNSDSNYQVIINAK